MISKKKNVAANKKVAESADTVSIWYFMNKKKKFRPLFYSGFPVFQFLYPPGSFSHNQPVCQRWHNKLGKHIQSKKQGDKPPVFYAINIYYKQQRQVAEILLETPPETQLLEYLFNKDNQQPS